jgi:acetyltransferase-like isoleucine patch superfamily enzyme
MNRFKRLAYSAVLVMLASAKSRTLFIKKHHLFGSVGENCMIMNRLLPLYSNLVYLHNNVYLASNVHFVPHDVIHSMLNNIAGNKGKFVEKIGCIEVLDNVFIGSGTRILFDTRIGTNVIIGSGSLVTKDIPDNSVYAGVPARYICSFDEYVAKHLNYSESFRAKFGLEKVCGVDDVLAAKVYEDFLKRREK